jgi:hypothetical protein
MSYTNTGVEKQLLEEYKHHDDIPWPVVLNNFIAFLEHVYGYTFAENVKVYDESLTSVADRLDSKYQ